MAFGFSSSSSTSSSPAGSSTSTPTAGVSLSPSGTNVFSSAHPPRTNPAFQLDLPPPNNPLHPQNTLSGRASPPARQTPSPSSSWASSEAESEFEGDERSAGRGGTLGRSGGGASTAASSWQSLLGSHHDKKWPSSRDGSTSGTEEATPRGELPPALGGEVELGAGESTNEAPAPSYFPSSYSFPPPQPPPSSHPTLPFPHHTAPLTTSPPPSSFVAPNPNTNSSANLHHPTPSISTTLSAESNNSTNSSSRSSVFSTASSRSSISSFGSSSSCSVSTPILPQPWPTADLSLGGANGEKVRDEEALVVETSEDSYMVVANLPGFSLDCITIATKQRRTLHIVADRWERESGAHFERKVTFGPDANLSKIRAQFDGNLLRVTVPRHPAPATSGSSTITKAFRSSAPSPPIVQPSGLPGNLSSPPQFNPTDDVQAGSSLEPGAERRTSLAGSEALGRLGLGTSREEIEREIERARARDSGRFSI